MSNPPELEVMVVDDDEIFASLLGDKFKLEDIKLTYAKDGPEALRLLAGGDVPNIILLDIEMPGMDGFEVLKNIREELKMTAIPVVVLSNYSRPEDVEWGRKLGVRKFLQKVDVLPSDIVDVVRECARR